MKPKITYQVFVCVLSLILARPLLSSFEEGQEMPRKVLLLYTERPSSGFWYSRAHQLGAMPLEHLGLSVEYQEISTKLPSIKEDPDYLGVVVFDAVAKNQEEAFQLIDYLAEVIDQGKKVVIIDEAPWGSIMGSLSGLSKANELYRKMGLSVSEGWSADSYTLRILGEDKSITGFERAYGRVLPSLMLMRVSGAKSHLDIGDIAFDEELITAVATSKTGGYIAPGFGFTAEYIGDREYRKWIVNPFAFFSLALDIESLPKPDVTTIAGRRIFYSHIDGDGWNNISEIDPDSKHSPFSSEIIMNRVIKENRDLPVTVAPIAADIDREWGAQAKSIEIAKELLAYEHIEAGTHTYTHPFFWEFFEDYSIDKEKPYLSRYRDETYQVQTFASKVTGWLNNRHQTTNDLNPEENESYEQVLKKTGSIPRAYARAPFDLRHEIISSSEKIDELLPKGKKVALVQWSGDCRVFKNALQMAEEAGLPSINGGDSRFDAIYPSYAWVRPLSSYEGGTRQHYASMSNENTYTDRWSGKFYGFNRLPETLENTESPLRLRPINLYYHMYTGQKMSSLNALLQNIEYIKGKKIIPINTSYYSKLVKGFYMTKFQKLDKDRYKVLNRGDIATIRWDKASDKGVDFENSQGVIGERHKAGSLYVYLDEKSKEPIIALKQISRFDKEPDEDTPYIIESRYRAFDVQPLEEGWKFSALGFGPLEMTWKVPEEGVYRVVAFTKKGEKMLEAIASKEREIVFSLDPESVESFQVNITKK